MSDPSSSWEPFKAPGAQPSGPTPGGPFQTKPGEKPFEKIGKVSLILAILELVVCAWKLITPMISKNMVDAQRGMFPSGPYAPNAEEMMKAAHEFTARIGPWEGLRALPFAIASAFLVNIAVRLRNGDRSALFTARKWVIGAAVAIAISCVIQALVIMPATMDYQHKIFSLMKMPPTAGAPFDIQKLMNSIMGSAAIVGLVIGAGFMAGWPIGLYMWSGKLIKETEPQAGGGDAPSPPAAPPVS